MAEPNSGNQERGAAVSSLGLKVSRSQGQNETDPVPKKIFLATKSNETASMCGSELMSQKLWLKHFTKEKNHSKILKVLLKAKKYLPKTIQEDI